MQNAADESVDPKGIKLIVFEFLALTFAMIHNLHKIIFRKVLKVKSDLQQHQHVFLEPECGQLLWRLWNLYVMRDQE